MTTSETPQPADQTSLRDHIATKLAEEFTSASPYVPRAEQRLDQGMMTHFTAEDGYRAMSPVTPREAATAVLAVLPESVDRAAVLREAADVVAALDRRKLGIQADTIRDAWEEGRDEGAAELRRMADETTATQTEAHPAEHRWAAELYDPEADEWLLGTPYADRDRAVTHLNHAAKIGPKWKDGTPTQRRLVRETTTYTVEPAAERTTP